MPKDLIAFTQQTPIKEKVDKIQLYKAKEKAYEKLRTKRDGEKQFNRKAALNAQLKILKKELEDLSRTN